MNKRKFVVITAGAVLALGVSLPYFAHAQGKKVFALVPKGINVPFYNAVESGGKAQAAKIGVECLYTGSANSDEAEQVQILRDLITKGVAGIAVAPVNGDSVVSVIAAARKKNIPVITFDSDAPKSERQAYIGTDNTDGGREAGKAFAKALPGKGKIAIITGHLAAVNHGERVKGFREGAGGGYTEVPGSPFPCDDDSSKCLQITQDILTRYPDLAGIYYTGGWAQFGAPEAYVKAISKKDADMKSGKFVVVAFDSLPAQLKLVKEGHCNALIGQRPTKMGSDSMDALMSLADGKKAENINTGVDVITKENVGEFMK